MRNFQDTFETHHWSFSAFSICMAVPLTLVDSFRKLENRYDELGTNLISIASRHFLSWDAVWSAKENSRLGKKKILPFSRGSFTTALVRLGNKQENPV